MADCYVGSDRKADYYITIRFFTWGCTLIFACTDSILVRARKTANVGCPLIFACTDSTLLSV